METMFLSLFRKNVRSPVFWIFFLAIFIRLLLAFVNLQANDNHIGVILRILTGKPTGATDCWECYQPKFYYRLSAIISRLLFARNAIQVIIISQLLNCFAGIATLIFVWKFIQSQKISPAIKYIVFALVSLNPDLIGINIQVTNDSFVIFFSTVSIYFLWKYVRDPKFLFVVFLSLATGFAIISKGSGLVTCIGILISFWCMTLPIWRGRKDLPQLVKAVSFFCLISFLFFLLFSPFPFYLQKYHTISISNYPTAPPANLFKNTFVNRPGITSIIQGYGTFYFLDLLTSPYITNLKTFYPLHRTSLWSQLYGRTFSIHFAQWPPAWANTSPLVLNLTTFIFVLALLPSGVFLFGLVQSLLQIFRRHFPRMSLQREDIFILVFSLFILMLIGYTYTFRDFSFMKSIFIYPSLLSIVYFLCRGGEYFERKLGWGSARFRIGYLLVVSLVFLQVIDAAILFFQLI